MLAREAFGRTSRGKVVEHQPDGSMRVVLPPARTKDFRWHRPERHLPAEQWQPATGITRWEFERRHTPADQARVLKLLGDRYRAAPPPLPDQDLWNMVQETMRSQEQSRLHNGLPGEVWPEEVMERLCEVVLETTSPDGQWKFLIQAVRFGRTDVADRLDVRHSDYRTTADWTLLCRFRAWVLPDDRDCFLFMPGQQPGEEGWSHRYENNTPNNLAMLAPRWEAQQ